jgi:isopropylmalate/homocitrate/citramalate synthase
VQRRCELIGITLDRRELDLVYRAVIEHADREKVVTDHDLAAIAARLLLGPSPVAPLTMPDFSSTPAEVGYGHGV